MRGWIPTCRVATSITLWVPSQHPRCGGSFRGGRRCCQHSIARSLANCCAAPWTLLHGALPCRIRHTIHQYSRGPDTGGDAASPHPLPLSLFPVESIATSCRELEHRSVAVTKHPMTALAATFISCVGKVPSHGGDLCVLDHVLAAAPRGVIEGCRDRMGCAALPMVRQCPYLEYKNKQAAATAVPKQVRRSFTCPALSSYQKLPSIAIEPSVLPTGFFPRVCAFELAGYGPLCHIQINTSQYLLRERRRCPAE